MSKFHFDTTLDSTLDTTLETIESVTSLKSISVYDDGIDFVAWIHLGILRIEHYLLVEITFNNQCSYHIETRHLICTNQLTDFHIMIHWSLIGLVH